MILVQTIHTSNTQKRLREHRHFRQLRSTLFTATKPMLLFYSTFRAQRIDSNSNDLNFHINSAALEHIIRFLKRKSTVQNITKDIY